MSQDLKTLRNLSQDDKQRFFTDHRYLVKEGFSQETGSFLQKLLGGRDVIVISLGPTGTMPVVG